MSGLLLLLLLASEAPASADPQAIPNYVRIRPDVAAAGQPSRAALEGLAKLGFRTVVNLRREDEDGPKDERAIVEGQGLRYVSVPLTAATLSRNDVDAVRRVLEDPKAGPVLFHCSSANRVGGVWALIQADRGVPLEDAIADGKKVGLKGETMIEAVKRVASQPAPSAP